MIQSVLLNLKIGIQMKLDGNNHSVFL